MKRPFNKKHGARHAHGPPFCASLPLSCGVGLRGLALVACINQAIMFRQSEYYLFNS
ncbi:MAG: hypothetical protein ACWA6Y_09370 [Polaromonas sp.]